MILELAHRARLRGALVIHSQKMKDAVNQEVSQLAVQPPSLGLTLGGFDRNDHIPQAIAPMQETLAFQQRKRQYIGRHRGSAKAARDVGHTRIVNEGDRELRVSESQGV